MIYLILGCLWIFFSDRLAFVIASGNEPLLLIINTYKGLAFVLITFVILYILICRLLRKVERSEQENLYLSYFDVLTGLYNRRYYELEVGNLDTEKNLPISVILVDINGLKMINDAFGRQLGDEILQRAAEVIREGCDGCGIAARWSGDEFIVFLPRTPKAEAENIANRILEACQTENIGVFQLSMSLGWDTKTCADTELAEILRTAEDRMYDHKLIQNKGLRGDLLNTIIHTLYEKNPREEQHSERVGEVAGQIGSAMGFSDLLVSRLKIIGHLHDIGKIAIEETILNKTDSLSEREREEIRRHPDVGYRILSAASEMQEMADCVLAHHERWDGKGYPRGLAGEAIPLEARIIALADSYDAMSSERPYRKALDDDVILYEIRKNAGLQFDPEIARIFVEKVLGRTWN
ncbi:MAG TPA: diguanylate cyclase [Bacillota bacterium]|nr:diguanylate cyclase [Bacillota bacterium]